VMRTDRTVDQVMVTIPKTLDASSTVSTVRAALANDHVHMVLLVDGRRLLGTVTAADLASAVDPDSPAVAFSSLRGRIVQPGRPVRVVMASMVATGRRRLAVVDDDHRLLGLLCLKRTLDGFCTDDGVRARAAERAQMAPNPHPAYGRSRH
jgi:CBS domain-containing protein